MTAGQDKGKGGLIWELQGAQDVCMIENRVNITSRTTAVCFPNKPWPLGELWGTVAVHTPKEQSRGVTVRFVGRTEPWECVRFGLLIKRTARFVVRTVVNTKSIKPQNRVVHHVKLIGIQNKEDWTFEPYKNFSEGARTKQLQFHINHPSAPRDHRVTSEP